MDAVLQAFALVATPQVAVVMLLSGMFGMFVGAVPGPHGHHGHGAAGADHVLPAAGAGHRLHRHGPRPWPSLRATSRGALLRIPGTPGLGRLHRRVLCDDAQGRGREGAGHRPGVLLHRRAVRHGGADRGRALRSPSSPSSSVRSSTSGWSRWAWTCAVFITSDAPLKGVITLFLGLLIGCVGLENPAAHYPRFTFGSADLLGGRKPDPGHDRHVRDLRDPALHVDDRANRQLQPAARLGVQGHGWADAQVPAADAARQRAGHGGGHPARRGRRHRGLDVVRDEQEALQGTREVRHRPPRGPWSKPAPPTTARWPGPGCRRWCSAFRATRSPPS